MPTTIETAGRGRFRAPMLRPFVLVVGAVFFGLLVVSTAWAFWPIDGEGVAGASTGTLHAPADVAGAAPIDSGTVAVTWTGSQLGTGQPAQGYFVIRARTADGVIFPACGTSAASPTTAASCNDVGVPDGTYRYTVTAQFGSWITASSPSDVVQVINDSSLPTVAVTSISPPPNGNGYNDTSPVEVSLSASAGFGVESITYTIDSELPVTVFASTADIFIAGDGIHTTTFSARDLVGNESAIETVLVRIDTTAPAAPSTPTLTMASDSGSSSSDGITNVTLPYLTGAAESGSTVTLFDGPAVVGSAMAVSGTYTIRSTALANGGHLMSARATDIAGNVSPGSPSTTVTIDTTPPLAPPAPTLTAASDSGTSSTDGITRITTPTLTGAAEVGSTVRLYSSTTLIGTTGATDGTYAVTSIVLTAGVKTMTVKATDVAGNVGPSSATTLVTIDITAPAKPTSLLLPAASDTGRSSTDKITSVTTPTVTGTVTAVTGTVVTVYDGATVLGIVTTGTTSFAIVSPPLIDASHTVTAKAADIAGNLSTASTAITVVIDTVVPAAPVAPKLTAATDTGRSTTDGITKITTPVAYGTNESKAIVKLYDGALQVGSSTTTSTSYSITTTVLAAGSHNLTATATDVAGNLGPLSTGTVITIDTTAPPAPSKPAQTAATDTGISSTDGITKTTKPIFTGTAEAVALVSMFRDGVATGSVVLTGVNYTATTSTLTSGTYAITVKATDVAGNLSPASASTTVVIDTVLPTVTVNQAAAQPDPTTESPILFTIAFAEPVTGFISTDVTLSGTAAPTTPTASGDGPTYTAAITGMTKTGTVVAAITASKALDIAGNANSASTFTDNSVSYVDVTPPPAPSAPTLAAASDTGVSSTDRITRTTTPIFTGTAEIGSTVKLFDGPTQVGTVVAAAGTYSITSATLGNGVHTITAIATDAALHQSPPSAGTTVIIDTVAPTVTVNQASSQPDPTGVSPLYYAVTFSETTAGFTNVDVTLGGTAGATFAAITGSDATYHALVSGMTRSGTVIATIAASKATDIAGNNNTASTSTDNTITYTDTIASTVEITNFVSAPLQAVTATGTAGYGPGDTLTITVVVCTQVPFPCLGPNIKATLSGVAVSPATGAWTVTSGSLGANPTLYAQATQTDLTGNTGISNVAGPIASARQAGSTGAESHSPVRPGPNHRVTWRRRSHQPSTT